MGDESHGHERFRTLGCRVPVPPACCVSAVSKMVLIGERQEGRGGVPLLLVMKYLTAQSVFRLLAQPSPAEPSPGQSASQASIAQPAFFREGGAGIDGREGFYFVFVFFCSHFCAPAAS